MSVITIADGKVTDIPLGGIAPQVAVTRDDKFVFVSLYDTKEVIQYDLKNGQIIRIPLPGFATESASIEWLEAKLQISY